MQALPFVESSSAEGTKLFSHRVCQVSTRVYVCMGVGACVCVSLANLKFDFHVTSKVLAVLRARRAYNGEIRSYRSETPRGYVMYKGGR